jgi:DNA-binding GntR family transcriptional regulator
MTPSPTPPLPADESCAEWIYSALHDRIVNGEGPPGERLREEDLAQRFGVSRTPIREALHRLQTEGLVVSRPGRALVGAGLDDEEIADIYVQREVLEGAASRLAASRELEQDIDHLEVIVQALEVATTDPTTSGWCSSTPAVTWRSGRSLGIDGCSGY